MAFEQRIYTDKGGRPFVFANAKQRETKNGNVTPPLAYFDHGGAVFEIAILEPRKEGASHLLKITKKPKRRTSGGSWNGNGGGSNRRGGASW